MVELASPAGEHEAVQAPVQLPHLCTDGYVSSAACTACLSTTSLTRAMLVQLIGFNSFRTAALTMSGLLAYDVFWVFGSKAAVGQNVMLAMATSEVLAGPVRLLFPHAIAPGTHPAFPFSLLGEPATFPACLQLFQGAAARQLGGAIALACKHCSAGALQLPGTLLAARETGHSCAGDVTMLCRGYWLLRPLILRCRHRAAHFLDLRSHSSLVLQGWEISLCQACLWRWQCVSMLPCSKAGPWRVQSRMGSSLHKGQALLLDGPRSLPEYSAGAGLGNIAVLALAVRF